MIKKFFRCLVVLLIFALLTGCGNTSESSLSNSGSQTSESSVSAPVSVPDTVSTDDIAETATSAISSANSDSVSEPVSEPEPVVEPVIEPRYKTVSLEYSGNNQILAWDKLEAPIPAELLMDFIDGIEIKYNFEITNPNEDYWEITIRTGWEEFDVVNGEIEESTRTSNELTVKYSAELLQRMRDASDVSVYGANVTLKSLTVTGEILARELKKNIAYNIHLAKGSRIEIAYLGASQKNVDIENPSVLNLEEGGELIALSEGVTKMTCETADEFCEYTVTVFDQASYLSPDYTTITVANYFEVMNSHKKAMDELLDCDIIAFTTDFYTGNESYCKKVDSNFLDLMEGPFDLFFNCSYNSKPKYHYYSIMTGFEGQAEYIDLSFSEGQINSFKGEKIFRISVDSEKAGEIRKMGRLNLVGDGYKLSRITLIGSPVEEYTGITATESSPVLLNGALSVSGSNIVGSDGSPVRLNGIACGWNTEWLQYCNSKTYAFLRDDWGLKAIRIGFTIDQEEGYCMKNGRPDEIYYFVCEQIDACIEAGMYAVVDWHMFGNPLKRVNEANEFFDKISKKYANVPNVIYEICNEPCDDPATAKKEDSWSNIKKYANTIIPTIRNNSPEAIVICGSPSYSNDLASVMKDPLKYDNLVYTDHIYEWHHDTQLPLEKKAVNNGFALLITETNPSYDDGGKIGKKDDSNFTEWEEFWSQNNIGTFAHYLSNDSGFTMLTTDTSARYGWTEDNYTEVGKYMRSFYRKAAGLE